MKKICFVTYETRFSGRLDATAGLAALIASLGKHMGNIPFIIFHTEPCDHLRAFSERFGPPCVFRKVDEAVYYSWYGKPNAILSMLDSGYDRVCWIDSDIIFTRECTEMLFPEGHAVLRTTQAPETPRCKPERHIALFGVPPFFELGTSISSGIVSATAYHREIVVKWAETMKDNFAFFKKNKNLFFGDQEVLESVLMNMRNLNTVISPILNDRDHLTCTPSIGIRRALKLISAGAPPIVHSSPYKAWWPLDRPVAHGSRAFLDCTPYAVEARRFRHAIRQLESCAFLKWLTPSTIRSKICLALPPWTFASPLLWYFVLGKLFKESYEPSDFERKLASRLEAERDVIAQK